MKDLIEALQIMNKYGNPRYPTHCGHDTLYVCIDPALVSEEDIERLEVLGFCPSSEDNNSFSSYRYGSA